ncbi:MAG: DinB family protein, partial [Acidimicrobiales bacterium]
MGAERDWVRIVESSECDECGFDSANIDVSSLATALEVAGGSWAALLASASTADLRTRPEPAVWSALEYGAHVGDVLALFAARIDRTVAEDEPDLGWWDHEAAVVAEGYNDRDPSDVARAVEAGVEALIVSTDGLADDEWQRAATRRERERFTVEGMARFALHEAQHHLVDARSSIARRAHDESMARDMARV